MTKSIVFVVEGHGEVEAVPILARRLMEICGTWSIEIPKPIRVPRDRFLNRVAERARVLALAKAKAGDGGHVIVLLDADDDCPARMVEHYLPLMTGEVLPIALSFVLAKKEYECWFLGAAESLRGKRGLRLDLDVPSDPEQIRGAKRWLSDRMSSGATYSETLDQPALTSEFDIRQARENCPSFDKFCREICRAVVAAK